MERCTRCPACSRCRSGKARRICRPQRYSGGSSTVRPSSTAKPADLAEKARQRAPPQGRPLPARATLRALRAAAPCQCRNPGPAEPEPRLALESDSPLGLPADRCSSCKHQHLKPGPLKQTLRAASSSCCRQYFASLRVLPAAFQRRAVSEEYYHYFARDLKPLEHERQPAAGSERMYLQGLDSW